MERKIDKQIAKELVKIPKRTFPPKPELITNRVCDCGKKIGENDTYFIRIEPQETPVIVCEYCM